MVHYIFNTLLLLALTAFRIIKRYFRAVTLKCFVYYTELKEAKLRKKQLERQLKMEEQLVNAAHIWNSEIVPKWDTM
jgi:hypothetical protein